MPKAKKPTKPKRSAKKSAWLNSDKLLAIIIVAIAVLVGLYWYSQSHRAKASGWVGLMNQYHCSDSGTGLPATVVAGSNGGCVKLAQFLIWTEQFRYDQPFITIDGDYNDTTTTAIKSFQQKNGLTSTGTIDDSTWTKLKACIDDHSATAKTVWSCSKI